ncbi:MAG: primosomal protein N' [Anaerolineales bacterium]|nr:MAG: primosomal protein N' [Anaerolineales bacterium]
MPEYVELAVNVPKVSGVFHYHVPPELEQTLRPGHLVLAPFGKLVVQGVVLRRVDQPEVAETRPIDSLLDDQPVLTAAQIELARQLAHSTLAPLAACVALMLPPGISQAADVLYSLTDTAAPADLPAAQRLVLDTLTRRGPLRTRQLDKALPRRNWRASIRALQGRGLITTQPVIPMPRQKAKLVRTARLLHSPPPELKLGKTAATHARRTALLEVLQRESGPTATEWLYAESGAKLADLRFLEEQGYVELGEAEQLRDPLVGLQTAMDVALRLTPAQDAAWRAVETALSSPDPKPILLHGVTSSGKTEIYLRAVAHALEAGRTALVLVPEIALTPQTVQRFFARFGNQVGLLHSELSDGERYDTWRRVRRGELRVVVGPRSALFAPLENIGLIVLDEEHDDSYYEAQQDVHYHARSAALQLGKISNALVLLGSATPDVGSYTQARSDAWQLLQLPERVQAHGAIGDAIGKAPELPPVEVIDMRRELKAGNRSIFSRALQTELEQVLQRSQQAILFLNRRGSATYVFCRDCGHVMRCPNCETPLAQHGSGELAQELVCHQCGYQRTLPQRCPNCESAQIRHYGTGTESVVKELARLLPSARSLRWDRDSTRTKGAHERILYQFAEHQADVLVGTQMLTKGLDLPKVTLVGVVLADVGLQLPHYRAAERVFQLLTQVAGRAGRSALGGRVIFQTFQPQHYAIQAAAAHDYAGFYETESAYRRQLRYPPFAQLVRMEFRHLDARKAEQEAGALAAELHAQIARQGRGATDVIGPAPSFHARVNKEYRWQLLLRGPQPAELLRGLRLPGWRIEVNPPAPL